jgi:hypothetical protein
LFRGVFLHGISFGGNTGNAQGVKTKKTTTHHSGGIMKRVLFAFVVVIAAFAVGCQDSITTGPVAQSNNQLSDNTPVNQILNFKGIVVPGSAETIGSGPSFNVNGQVFIAYRIVGTESDPTISFSIGTEATITPTNQILPSGTIGNNSRYDIPVASKVGVIYIPRDYYVEGIGTKLHIMFAVAEDNTFSVVSMTMDPIAAQPGTTRIE